MYIRTAVLDLRFRFLALALLASVASCGPLSAMTTISDAEDALEDAEAADAQQLAPYWYWMSMAYLRKAKTTEGYAEYEASNGFARKAVDLARQATVEAGEQKLRLQRFGEQGSAP